MTRGSFISGWSGGEDSVPWVSTLLSCSSVVNVNVNVDREPNCSISWSLLISLGLKLGKDILNFGGNPRNLAFLDLYSQTSNTSLELSNFFMSTMFCVNSEMLLCISTSCLFRTSRCLDSISLNSHLSLLTISSISLCQISRCVLRDAAIFCEFFFKSTFWTWMWNAIFFIFRK